MTTSFLKLNGCCHVRVTNISLVNFSSTRKRCGGIRNASSYGRSFAIGVFWLPLRNPKQRPVRVGKTDFHYLGNDWRKTLDLTRTSGPKVELFSLETEAPPQSESGIEASTPDSVREMRPELRTSAPKDSALAGDTKRRETSVSPFSLKFWLKPAAYAVVISILSVSLYFGAEAGVFFDCSNLSTYYAPLHGLKGQELKATLHEIIKGHKVVSYIQAWDALKVLDEAEDDPNSVIEIYSLKKVAKSRQAKADGWNREHLWPRSYGLVMGRPEFSDLQNLRPADVNVNSSRGNKYFAECTTSDHCLLPANREAAIDTGTNRDLWMPPAQVRGDIARALMYMAVRYGSEQSELQLSNSPSIGTAQMGLLSDILLWNEIDPPSPAEKLRNSRICQLYQHNRNPFIDHPEYAKRIWGGAAQDRPITPGITPKLKAEASEHEGKRLKHQQQPKRLPS